MPSLVLVHDNIGGPTGMGKVASWIARSALSASWNVTLVADFVEHEYVSSCSVVHAAARRSLPAVPQHLDWVRVARRRLRELEAEVVHVHAPGLIGSADVMTCHHLAAAAHAHGVQEPESGVGGALRRSQARWQRGLDDRWYRRRSLKTRMTFVSDFLRDEFARRYGLPTDGAVLPPPAPAWRPVTPGQRDAARRDKGIAQGAFVVGYLGGDDVRKGVADVAGLASADGLTLLVAGPGSEALNWEGARGLGFVEPDTVIEACDVVVAPALFDAAPVAVIEPIARGVPVVVRRSNGWASAIERHHAGVVWDSEVNGTLEQAARSAVGAGGGQAMVAEVSEEALRSRLFDVYGRVIEQGSAR